MVESHQRISLNFGNFTADVIWGYCNWGQLVSSSGDLNNDRIGDIMVSARSHGSALHFLFLTSVGTVQSFISFDEIDNDFTSNHVSNGFITASSMISDLNDHDIEDFVVDYNNEYKFGSYDSPGAVYVVFSDSSRGALSHQKIGLDVGGMTILFGTQIQ